MDNIHFIVHIDAEARQWFEGFTPFRGSEGDTSTEILDDFKLTLDRMGLLDLFSGFHIENLRKYRQFLHDFSIYWNYPLWLWHKPSSASMIVHS